MIKIGNQYFNLDNVRLIEDMQEYTPTPSNRINIYFAGTTDEDGWSVVEGAEADALRRYLQRTAVDLLGQAENDLAYQVYRERGGQLGYDAWRADTTRLASYHSKSETWWESPSNQKLVSTLEAELKL